MHRNQSVSAHSFAMVLRADIPRSRFNVQTSHKTTFDAGKLIPIYVDEVLPGDTFSLSCTAFGRMATPIFPIMDNLHMDTFFFFVPYRLLWDNWKRFMGEQRNPGDSTSFLVPQVDSPVGGWPIGSIGDYFGLPTVGQVSAGKRVTHSALPLRAYNLIFNEWFRDENLVPSLSVNTGDVEMLAKEIDELSGNVARQHLYAKHALTKSEEFKVEKIIHLWEKLIK